jgi:hypothetical protein
MYGSFGADGLLNTLERREWLLARAGEGVIALGSHKKIGGERSGSNESERYT